MQEVIEMVSPLILNGGGGPRLFLNLSGNVGPNSPNSLADVLDVSFPASKGTINSSYTLLRRSR